ncbi:GNAT family N-acetyltransferase [Arenicella xantha]|uniref:N-acetylglutamate synthase-like GNAT family acetyltransferase n=1 Tax=Arenicella xantha TaxID=644221 RepID=A0A395JKV8_9GAMM|nr:GNAT family N-acetyltransferase [Arenicella xantha]RBP48342.1 N-acetylglutamate synthase-like GNAT family acetyltransferase [Arenicella xantha]
MDYTIEYRFSTDQNELPMDTIHRFLSSTYWAKGIPRDVLERAIQHSLCFGMVGENGLVAFGRFVTDRATFAYLADVFVVDELRGRGLAKSMLRQALELPEVKQLRRILLATSDAHGLYQKLGFNAIDKPALFMQKLDYSLYDIEPS